jgi:hypothetical protein
MLVQAPRSDRDLRGREYAVDVIARPFIQLWRWVEQVGGFPGQMFFICTVIICILGALTWYGNKR